MKWELIGEYEYACKPGTNLNPNQTAMRKKPGSKDETADKHTVTDGSCKTPKDAKAAFDKVYADH
ncbi:hypothetical protein PXQ17_001530 [Vibrio parahaemolyticus]|nr:hypothetical protein [Vibrio parahaemolyticus]